jgi:YVTN family beta-propeller protein
MTTPRTTRRSPSGCVGITLAIVAVGALLGSARAEAETKAYIANSGANVVTVLDTATEAIVTTIPVGAHPVRVALSPDGTRAYVSNRDADSVSVIDTGTDTVVATIPVGDSPATLAVVPSGDEIYVVVNGGAIQVIERARGAVAATIPVPGNGGGLAFTPDGSRAYVASGPISVIDTATRTVVHSFLADSGSATAVAVSPNGSRAYFGTNGTDPFGGGAGVAVLDTATNAVVANVTLGTLPGQIALAPDGSRAYVGVQALWVNTGYGAAFIPGASVTVIDTTTTMPIASINLGSGGAAWFLQNTAAGIGVTPDRSDIYVAIPRINSIAVINTSTNVVRQLVPVTGGPNGLAIVPDGSVAITPYAIDAVNDTAPWTTPSTGATAVANVLANDKLGGVPVALAHVSLSKQSSTHPAIALDPTTGAVTVAWGAPIGPHSLVYRICEIGSPLNCDEATVTLTVRDPYVIDAVNDAAWSVTSRTAIVSVLANDTLGGAPVVRSHVALSLVSSTHTGVTLNLTYGSVFVAVGTPVGTHSLVYQICEMADPTNCDQATAAVTVIPNPIDAVNDTGVTTRSGGLAVANVLTNDRLSGATATLAKVTLALASSTTPGVTLNATGSVTVAAGTAAGVHSLVYRVCEIANPANCDDATVTVTVNPYVINAVNDYARASSKTAGTALASVLANDFLGNVRATMANVRLSLVSLTPANSKIVLDLSDGSVDVLGKTESGVYLLVYEICEIASPTNCDRATVSLDLSGGL